MPKKKKGKAAKVYKATEKAKDLMKGIDLLETENAEAPLRTAIAMTHPKDKRVCPVCGSLRTVNKLLFSGKGLYKLCNNCFTITDPNGYPLMNIIDAESFMLEDGTLD